MRRLLALVLLLLAIPASAQVSYYWNIIGLDLFPYANGTLTGKGNWVTASGGTNFVSLNVVSNTLQCASIGSTDCGNQYTTTFPNDQCSQIPVLTLNNVSSASFAVAVRSSGASSNNFYALAVTGTFGTNASTMQMYKLVAGSLTVLVSSRTETINSGDQIGICAQGTEVYATIRGAQSSTIVATDSSLTAGSPAVIINSNGQAETDVILGKWSGFYLGTTVVAGGGGTSAIKWHPGHYALSETFVEPGNPNATQIQSEVAIVRAGPSQVLGYVPIFWWNTIENTTAGVYDFSLVDKIYVQLLTGSTTWTTGSAMPALSSPRRLGLYMNTSWFFNANPATQLPTYITSSATYGPLGPDGTHYGYWTAQGSTGGCSGTVGALWRPAEMARYIALWRAASTHVLPDGNTLDSSPYVEMIAPLQETAAIQPGGTCGTDSSYASSTANAQAQTLDVAMGPIGAGTAFTRTNVQMFNNYAPGGPDESAALAYTLPTSGTAAGGPDTFGISSGNNAGVTCGTGLCGLTWGQAAYIGNVSPGDAHPGNLWGVGGGTDLRGTIAGMFQIQGTELGFDVTYTPSDIFSQLNTTLKATHAIWDIVGPGTFTGGAINGNWWGSCSNQTTWNAAPSTCGGVLFVITTDTLSQIACPTSYTHGCNTSMLLPAANDDHFHRLLDGRLKEAA